MALQLMNPVTLQIHPSVKFHARFQARHTSLERFKFVAQRCLVESRAMVRALARISSAFNALIWAVRFASTSA